MAEGVSSISSHSHRVPGSAAKDDRLLSSQKKALRDVKNTLQSHSDFRRPASKPVLDSFNSVPVNQDLGSRPVIYCDSDNQFWDPCDCSQTDDGLVSPRLPDEYLNNTDFSYIKRGLLGIPSSDYGNDSDCSDVECSYLDEPFIPNLHDFMDTMFPELLTKMDLSPINLDLDLDPPLLIDPWTHPCS